MTSSSAIGSRCRRVQHVHHAEMRLIWASKDGGSFAACASRRMSRPWGLGAASVNQHLEPDDAGCNDDVRPEVVTHPLGTSCHPCLRAGHVINWCRKSDSNPRPPQYELAG